MRVEWTKDRRKIESTISELGETERHAPLILIYFNSPALLLPALDSYGSGCDLGFLLFFASSSKGDEERLVGFFPA